MELGNIKLNANDKKLIKFLARFRLMLASDAIFFYKTSYYQKRLQELKRANYITRFHKSYIKLSLACLRYLDENNIKYYFPCKNKTSIDRYVLVSKIGIELEKASIPYRLSWEMKDSTYTEWSRRFIAEIELRNEKYLIYYAKLDDKYIRSIHYDINKDIEYNNIIIFTEKVDIINSKMPFVFSNKLSVLIMNRNKIYTLSKYNNIDIKSIIGKIYNKEVLNNDISIADCKVDNKDIIFMPYLDTHRITSLNNLYSLGFIENKIEILSFRENLKVIKKLLNESIKDSCSFKELEESLFYE